MNGKSEYEYKCVKCEPHYKHTQEKLNELGFQGWKVICPYASGYYLLLERKR